MTTILPSGGIVGDSPFLWTIKFEESGIGSLLPLGSTPDFSSGMLIWTHINISDLRGRHWIEAQEFLSIEARELLTEPLPQRLHASGPALWGVLFDYAQEFGLSDESIPSTEDLTHLRFAVGPGYVITARMRPSRSASTVRRAVLQGSQFTSAYDLVEAIVDESMKAMDGAIDRLADNLNEVEDRVLDDNIRDERRHLGVLRRALIRVHREVGGALRMVSRFDPKGQSAPAAHAVVQQFALRLDSCNQEIQATEERARLLQDEIVSKLTTETNRQLYVLTTLSTLLMPPTLITGIFGMNVRGLPFADQPGSGFHYAIVFCLVAAFMAWVLMWSLRSRNSGAPSRASLRRARKTPPPPSHEDG